MFPSRKDGGDGVRVGQSWKRRMCKKVGDRMMYPACGEARSNSENVEHGWGLVWRVGEKAGEGGGARTEGP